MVMGLKNLKNQEKSRGKQGFCLARPEEFDCRPPDSIQRSQGVRGFGSLIQATAFLHAQPQQYQSQHRSTEGIALSGKKILFFF